MLKIQITSQSKISARGYLEIRTTLLTLIPLALLYAGLKMKCQRFPIVTGGIVLEFLDWLDKVFFDSYQRTHGHNRGTRGLANPIVRDVVQGLRVRPASGGGHRKLVL